MTGGRIRVGGGGRRAGGVESVTASGGEMACKLQLCAAPQPSWWEHPVVPLPPPHERFMADAAEAAPPAHAPAERSAGAGGAGTPVGGRSSRGAQRSCRHTTQQIVAASAQPAAVPLPVRPTLLPPGLPGCDGRPLVAQRSLLAHLAGALAAGVVLVAGRAHEHGRGRDLDGTGQAGLDGGDLLLHHGLRAGWTAQGPGGGGALATRAGTQLLPKMARARNAATAGAVCCMCTAVS